MDNDLKMLFQVQQGNIIHIVGRLLQPFCSHALYRVRVTDLHSVGHGCFVIQGSLVDFKDSPVQSYALHGKRLFRWEETMRQINLSREDIERVVREQGVSVRFTETKASIYVYAWKYLCAAVTKQGKPTSKSEEHYLGKLSAIALMDEEDLAALVRTKFRIAVQEEAEKVEELV